MAKKTTSEKMKTAANNNGSVVSVEVRKDGTIVTSTEWYTKGKLARQKTEYKSKDGSTTTMMDLYENGKRKSRHYLSKEKDGWSTLKHTYYRKDGQKDYVVTFISDTINGKPSTRPTKLKNAEFYYYDNKGLRLYKKIVKNENDFDKLEKNRDDTSVKCDVKKFLIGSTLPIYVDKDGNTIKTQNHYKDGKLVRQSIETINKDGTSIKTYYKYENDKIKEKSSFFYRKDGPLDHEVKFGEGGTKIEKATYYYYTNEGVLQKTRTVNNNDDYTKLEKNRDDASVKCFVTEYSADGKSVIHYKNEKKEQHIGSYRDNSR